MLVNTKMTPDSYRLNKPLHRLPRTIICFTLGIILLNCALVYGNEDTRNLEWHIQSFTSPRSNTASFSTRNTDQSTLKASKFTLDPYFGQNCTDSLQCGTKGLICLEGICLYCTSDQQCSSTKTLFRCFTSGINATIIHESTEFDFDNSSALLGWNASDTYGTCQHKQLFKPLHWRDFVTAIILFIGSCVAAGAGVGGGGLNVPILAFIGQFPASGAIPLSSVMIGGAAIANFIYAVRLRRAAANRPLIDYHTTLLLQPLAMGGSVLGIVLNRFLPDWFILLILICILAFTVWTTVGKFRKAWKQDHSPAPSTNHTFPDHASTELKTMSQVSSETQLNELTDDQDQMEIQEDAEIEIKLEDGSSEDNTDPLLDHLELKETQIPWIKLGICFFILLAITVHSVLIGGKGGPSIIGIQPCSTLYWLLLFGIFPCLFVATYFIGKELVDTYHVKRSVGFHFQESDIEWTPKRTLITSVVATGAGILASLLGVGGGMLINPLLLELGVSPDCTAATSSLMILFTSISSIAQYGAIGRIQWDYAIFLFILGIIGSVVGQHILGWIVKRYRSQSYIILAMLMIVIPGGILLVTTTVQGLIGNIKAGAGIGFKQYCK